MIHLDDDFELEVLDLLYMRQLAHREIFRLLERNYKYNTYIYKLNKLLKREIIFKNNLGLYEVNYNENKM